MVSIIVPIYRIDEAYLRQCIESIIHQTFHDIEVILVDDGSPDNSGAICDEYAKKDERIRVIHQENAGVSVARNRGIEESHGEYIMFADPDDWFELDCLEKVLPEAEKQQVDLLYFQYFREEKGETLICLEHDSFPIHEIRQIQLGILRETSFFKVPLIASWGKVYRRSTIVDNNVQFPVGQKRAQDVIFNLYFTEIMQSAYYFNYAGYHYRAHSESVVRRYNPKTMEALHRWLEEAKKFVDRYHADDREYHGALGVEATCVLVTLENNYLLHKDCTLSKKEVIAEIKKFLNQDIVKADMAHCKMRDFQSAKSKIKYLLLKWHLFGVYYEYRSRKS